MVETAVLPLPGHFDPAKAASLWRVPYQERALEARQWARQHSIRHFSADSLRICLIPIDCQNTFCLPDFELFVAGRSGRGAIDDNVRLAKFIYRNLNCITDISPTLDTHTAIQIFHTPFWINTKGENPPPATIITEEDVRGGKWSVNPAIGATLGYNQIYLKAYGLHYAQTLARIGKYPLMVWPFHAMLGGIGHALVSTIEEAIFFHAIVRHKQTEFQIKGSNPLTENYSVLRPEVCHDQTGDPVPNAQRNILFIKKLLSYDRVVIAGQAMSHCVAWTIEDLLREIKAYNEKLVHKVYLLRDCTSPVVIPGVVDFTDDAEKAFQRFAAAGMKVVDSTDPIIFEGCD